MKSIETAGLGNQSPSGKGSEDILGLGKAKHKESFSAAMGGVVDAVAEQRDAEQRGEGGGNLLGLSDKPRKPMFSGAMSRVLEGVAAGERASAELARVRENLHLHTNEAVEEGRLAEARKRLGIEEDGKIYPRVLVNWAQRSLVPATGSREVADRLAGKGVQDPRPRLGQLREGAAFDESSPEWSDFSRAAQGERSAISAELKSDISLLPPEEQERLAGEVFASLTEYDTLPEFRDYPYLTKALRGAAEGTPFAAKLLETEQAFQSGRENPAN